ncbi:MAG: SH3 domain-containing protein [Flavobacteriaceae bacterium]
MKKLLYILFFISSFVSSQNSETLFKEANDLYKVGKYEEAISLYQKIEAQKVISSELYYNIGNCYYKLNNVAETIYNYEKALLIDPLNEDAFNNLIFAKRLTIDNIESLPKSVFQKFDENYIKKLSYNNWALLTVIFSMLASLLFLLFYFSYTPSKKRFYFTGSIICMILLIITISFSYKEYNHSISNIHAIIFAEKTDIKNAPTLSSENIFTLHEGTKVKVLDSVDNWKKIKLADGKIGWVDAEDLKVLKIF